jgi:hypothetical protein
MEVKSDVVLGAAVALETLASLQVSRQDTGRSWTDRRTLEGVLTRGRSERLDQSMRLCGCMDWSGRWQVSALDRLMQ